MTGSPKRFTKPKPWAEMATAPTARPVSERAWRQLALRRADFMRRDFTVAVPFPLGAEAPHDPLPHRLPSGPLLGQWPHVA